MKVSHLLAAVAVLGLAGFAMAAKEKGPKGLIGKVVSVTGTDVTVKAKTGEVVVKTDGNTAVTIDGAAASVDKLAKGMTVLVTPETGTATKIDAKAAAKKEGDKKEGDKKKDKK